MAVNLESKKTRQNPLKFGWVLPLFLRPRKTTTEIVEGEKPVWLTPLLILSLLVIIASIISGPIRQLEIQSGATLPVDFQYFSEEDQQKYLDSQASQSSPLFLYVFPVLSGLLKIWISWFLLSSVLYLSLTLAGSRAGSLKAYNLVAWSFLPWALRYLVQIVGMITSKSLISSPGFSGFIGADATGILLYVKSLLGLIDIYFLFQVVLLFVGVIPLSKLSKRKAWIATAVSILILLLLQGVPGLLSSALGGLSLSGIYF